MQVLTNEGTLKIRHISHVSLLRFCNIGGQDKIYSLLWNGVWDIFLHS